MTTTRSKIRKAKLAATAWEVTCPKCGMVLPEPYTGSFIWERANFENSAGQARTCDGCLTSYEIPSPR